MSNAADNAPPTAGMNAARRRRLLLWLSALVGLLSVAGWLLVVSDYQIALHWRDAHVHAVPLLLPVLLIPVAVSLLLKKSWQRWLAGVLVLVVALNAWVAALLMLLPLVLLRAQ